MDWLHFLNTDNDWHCLLQYELQLPLVKWKIFDVVFKSAQSIVLFTKMQIKALVSCEWWPQIDKFDKQICSVQKEKGTSNKTRQKNELLWSSNSDKK